MKLTLKMQKWLFPVIDRQQAEINRLHESLQEEQQLCKEQFKRSGELQTELEYLYALLAKRSRCRFLLCVFPRMSPILLTIGHKSGWLDFALYSPFEQQEIAHLYFRREATRFVLEDMLVAQKYQTRQIGELLMQEIVSEAQAMGLQRLNGKFGSADRQHFSELATFYKEMGFDVKLATDSLSGELDKTIIPAN